MNARKGQKRPDMLGNNYALGNKGGRPTKYDPKYCHEIQEYFDTLPNKNVDGRLVANELPTLRKFARQIGVNKSTLLEWADSHKEFSTALEASKESYKEFLMENGLLGLYNSAFAIFVATNTTDMKSKQEVDHTSKGEVMKAVSITILRPNENVEKKD